MTNKNNKYQETATTGSQQAFLAGIVVGMEDILDNFEAIFSDDKAIQHVCALCRSLQDKHRMHLEGLEDAEDVAYVKTRLANLKPGDLVDAKTFWDEVEKNSNEI